jgi:hypothetical protein
MTTPSTRLRPGVVRLNRDSLVLLCGLRLSPLVARVLGSDPDLGCGHDSEGRTSSTTGRLPVADELR